MNTTTPSGDSVIIGIGEYYVGSKTMTSIGLGSCVGLVIHDVEKSTGALVHIMLPSSQGKTDRPGNGRRLRDGTQERNPRTLADHLCL